MKIEYHNNTHHQWKWCGVEKNILKYHTILKLSSYN